MTTLTLESPAPVVLTALLSSNHLAGTRRQPLAPAAADAPSPPDSVRSTSTTIAIGAVGLGTFVAVVAADSSRVVYTIPAGYQSVLPNGGDLSRSLYDLAA